MKVSLGRFLLSACVCASTACVIQVGVTAEGPSKKPNGGATTQARAVAPPAAAKLSWDSPKIRAIQEEARRMPLPPTKSPGGNSWLRLQRLDDLLMDQLCEQKLNDLVESCATMPSLDKMPSFENEQRLLREGGEPIGALEREKGESAYKLLCTLTDILARLGDREALVTLLSLRCPDGLIEFDLVLRGTKLRDPILILGEAYPKSKVAEVRRRIAAAFRRGFTSLGITASDDDQFVKKSVAWYEKNKGDFQLNVAFGGDDHPVGVDENLENGPLFERRHARAAGTPRPVPTTNDWDSPKLEGIRRTWESMRVPPDTPLRHRDDKRIDQLVGLLRDQVSRKDLPELIASFQTMPLTDRDRGPFADALLQAVITVLADSRERDALVTLLSTRCPFSWQDVEWNLLCRGDKLNAPFLILGEAYSKCKTPSVRENLARRIRLAVQGLGIRGVDDDQYLHDAGQYIEKVMQWYKENKDNLTVNPEYARNVRGVDYEKHPLFKKVKM